MKINFKANKKTKQKSKKKPSVKENEDGRKIENHIEIAVPRIFIT